MEPQERKPDWLKAPLGGCRDLRKVRQTLSDLGLNTVCDEALCPNRGECWDAGTATFLILGDTCTRSCSFC